VPVREPEARRGRWGKGLTAEKMNECRWLFLVGQFEFVEWTADGHLRDSRFLALREDKRAEEMSGDSRDSRTGVRAARSHFLGRELQERSA
jgi:ATP-dependent DNA ligase